MAGFLRRGGFPFIAVLLLFSKIAMKRIHLLISECILYQNEEYMPMRRD